MVFKTIKSTLIFLLATAEFHSEKEYLKSLYIYILNVSLKNKKNEKGLEEVGQCHPSVFSWKISFLCVSFSVLKIQWFVSMCCCHSQQGENETNSFILSLHVAPNVVGDHASSSCEDLSFSNQVSCFFFYPSRLFTPFRSFPSRPLSLSFLRELYGNYLVLLLLKTCLENLE